MFEQINLVIKGETRTLIPNFFALYPSSCQKSCFSYLLIFLARGIFYDNGKKKGMIDISEGINEKNLKYWNPNY